ncbi:MAG: putative transcriptional regulator [Phenylobacterium sp.]|jgi:putative transcriptional regulator
MNEKNAYLLAILGERLKQTRLNADYSQQQVADIIGKSRTSVERAEKGKCTMETFVSILLALDASDHLSLFLPESPPSPVLLAKAKGKKRQRASKANKTASVPSSEDDLQW